MNISGMSHARSSEFVTDVFKHSISHSFAYCTKIKYSKLMKPEHGPIKKRVLKEPHLYADEFFWPLGGKRGYGIVLLGKDVFQIQMADSQSIETFCKIFPDHMVL